MRVTAAALALFLAATPGAAQEIDLVGTWACALATYGSGQAITGTESVFNMALYRDGSWASSGRYADGSPYQGQGTWRFGRNTTGGMEVRVQGQIRSGLALPEPFSFEADIENPDTLSRITKYYDQTTTVECARQG